MANSPPETKINPDPAQTEIPNFQYARRKRKRLTPSQRYFRRMQKRRWMLPLWIWLFTALPEVLLHLVSSSGGWQSGLILGPLFALVPAIGLYVLINSIPKPKLNYAIIIVYSIVLYVLYASQLVYYQVFGTFYSVYSMTNGASALQFVNTILTTVRSNTSTMFFMAVPMLILLVLGWRLFNFQPIRSWKLKECLLVLAAVVQIGLVQSLPLFGGTGDTTAYGLYHNASDSYTSVNKLGLMTAFRLDLTRAITGEDADGSIILESHPPQTEPTAGETLPPHTVPPQTETTAPAETEPPLDTSPNVLDIDFDRLIAETSNSSVREVHQYFSGRTPSSKNEMTGLFEGCNLILITAEAFSHLAVDPQRTPTLYKLMTEGISFSNYYVPDWGVSTTDGEYAFLTGTIPKSGVWSFKQSSDNAMPLTMSQQLLSQGYSAYAYHGHTYTYYGRDRYLTNLGFQYKGYGNGLDVTWQWPESDVEVTDLSTGDYVSDTPFVTYYMTISGHREFNFYGNSIAAKNKSLVADEPYSENVRAYLACQLELEMALTLLLERLEEAGVLENTVIVLTADHYPNGLTDSEIGELLGHTPESNFEIYQNGAFIYKPGMEPVVVDEPCSHLDLLPTLSNLFGLDFDSRLYMGRDVFSDAEPLVCLRNRSWITDKAMYNAQTGEVTDLTDTPVTDAYIRSISTEVNNRFTVSARILEYDYWSILFE